MKYLVSIILFSFSLVWLNSQPSEKFADAMYVYKGFGGGGTTANLHFFSKSVDTMAQVSKLELQAQYLDTLNYLVGHVESKRHFQQKVGPSYYASIIKNGKERKISIVPNLGIIDLANKHQYTFRNTPYNKVFDRFVDKNFR